jgi:Ca2+-binding EF-hand superfamily protein
MDFNGDRRLEKQEFLKAARIPKEEHLEEVLDQMDENGGGYVVFDELCIWMSEKQFDDKAFAS